LPDPPESRSKKGWAWGDGGRRQAGAMSTYVISEVEVVDEAEADRYRAIAERSIEQHGGRYIVRGARPDAVEGEWDSGRRLVIVEFPTQEAARRWYQSPEYGEALDIRATALRRRLLFADGIAPA
jgi:uncharacterized protein (DUF1330 family)